MAMIAVAAIGGGLKLAGGIFGSRSAKKRARQLARQIKAETAKLNRLESSRQQITNPYSGVKDMSSLAKDLSSKVTNPFANLSVATGAAEIQMEQSDIALANTLDTLRATGAGAGGATALAQAALQSKKGVAASIETQEAANAKLRAQGQQTMEQAQLADAQRIQGLQISEAGREQQLQGMGENIKLQMRENRESDKINYQRNKIAALTGAKNAASASASNQMSGAISGLGSTMMSFAAG
tara:strand:- start:3420 stop:4139 length:720 start_codon:yes stop_codon:yes gene_type:complete